MAKKSKSNKKIKIDASFEELVKESVQGNPIPERKRIPLSERENLTPKKAARLLGILHSKLHDKKK